MPIECALEPELELELIVVDVHVNSDETVFI